MLGKMKRFFKRKAPDSRPDDINWEEEIKYDLGLRKNINSYHPNLRERVRRKYLENGPCQPCRFQPEWFDEFRTWLEYSE